MDIDDEIEIETDLTRSLASPLSKKLDSKVPKPIRVILSTTFQFLIPQEDVDRLLEMRRISCEKEYERRVSRSNLSALVDADVYLPNDNFHPISSSDGTPIQRRDMEWLTIVLPFIRKYNPHCGICASSKNYGRRLDTVRGYLLRAYFYCHGRDCPFNCVVTVKENGRSLLCSRFAQGNIVDHRNAKRIACPNRSSNQTKLKTKRTSSRNPVRRHCKSADAAIRQWNDTCTETNVTNVVLNEFNLTMNDLEDPSLMSPAKRFLCMCCQLMQLTVTLQQDIDPTNLLPGALQHISIKPFYLVIHTENSIRYYHSVLTKEALSTPVTTMQQDSGSNTNSHTLIFNNDIACGSVHMNSSITYNSSWHPIVYVIANSVEHGEKTFFYFELMLSNLDDTSFIPITITYIEDTSDTVAQNYSIKSWLERFRFDHEYLYKSSLPSLSGTYSLPRPFVLLVDDHHETPLNNTLLQFFNNETFKEYIARTYQEISSKDDYPTLQEHSNRMVLHVSPTTILFHFRALVNKHVSVELRQLALWSSFLLLYTSTWHEMKQNWSLICEIFLNWGTNFVSLKAYEDLCAKVAQIDNDTEVKHLMDVIYHDANISQQEENDVDDDNEPPETIIDLSDLQNDHFYTKNMITNESNRYMSPYENDLRQIFNENNKLKSTLLSTWETLTISDGSTLKKIKGNWKWLSILLKDYTPTIPLWSNLIHSFTHHLRRTRLNERTSQLMVKKDKRVTEIKRIQSTEHIHKRMDHVINNLAKDLHTQVANADKKHRTK
ncbi:unnamed protein product [Adineta ricciae]|uniref:Uncharacterized protein n=1 Tax=Adineta ricciae TaxID=249248 RepID=A0A814NL17_ADIRI|nr:unnamed protein product [Adineta ricciae]